MKICQIFVKNKHNNVLKDFFNGNSYCYNEEAYNSSPEKIAGGQNFKVKELEVYLVEIE